MSVIPVAALQLLADVRNTRSRFAALTVKSAAASAPASFDQDLD